MYLSYEEVITEIIINCFKRGNKVLICGNGGSASQSLHFAAELVGKFELTDRKPLPAIALTANISTITAIGNDYGFEHVFSRQVEALGKPGDALIVLSTSGTSKNCLFAIVAAKNIGMEVIDFPREGDSTAEIQENQVKLMHGICREVEKEFV